MMGVLYSHPTDEEIEYTWPWNDVGVRGADSARTRWKSTLNFWLPQNFTPNRRLLVGSIPGNINSWWTMEETGVYPDFMHLWHT